MHVRESVVLARGDLAYIVGRDRQGEMEQIVSVRVGHLAGGRQRSDLAQVCNESRVTIAHVGAIITFGYSKESGRRLLRARVARSGLTGTRLLFKTEDVKHI